MIYSCKSSATQSWPTPYLYLSATLWPWFIPARVVLSSPCQHSTSFFLWCRVNFCKAEKQYHLQVRVVLSSPCQHPTSFSVVWRISPARAALPNPTSFSLLYGELLWEQLYQTLPLSFCCVVNFCGSSSTKPYLFLSVVWWTSVRPAPPNPTFFFLLDGELLREQLYQILPLSFCCVVNFSETSSTKSYLFLSVGWWTSVRPALPNPTSFFLLCGELLWEQLYKSYPFLSVVWWTSAGAVLPNPNSFFLLCGELLWQQLYQILPLSFCYMVKFCKRSSTQSYRFLSAVWWTSERAALPNPSSFLRLLYDAPFLQKPDLPLSLSAVWQTSPGLCWTQTPTCQPSLFHRSNDSGVPVSGACRTPAAAWWWQTASLPVSRPTNHHPQFQQHILPFTT